MNDYFEFARASLEEILEDIKRAKEFYAKYNSKKEKTGRKTKEELLKELAKIRDLYLNNPIHRYVQQLLGRKPYDRQLN